MREFVKEKKVQERYDEEFKRQAVELVIHSGKTQEQIARELGVSVRKPLRVIGANLSMSRVGNWGAFFSTLEREGFPDNQFFPSRVQARREIFETSRVTTITSAYTARWDAGRRASMRHSLSE
jgi:transposase